MRNAVLVKVFAFALIVVQWAASMNGAAHFLRLPEQDYMSRTVEPDARNRFERKESALSGKQLARTLCSNMNFREVEGRGLLVDVWLNDKWPVASILFDV